MRLAAISSIKKSARIAEIALLPVLWALSFNTLTSAM
jgi:hypothetical protein